MKPIVWDHDDWIVANFRRYSSTVELANAYNQEFGINVAYPTFMRHCAKTLNLRRDRSLTDEQRQWLIDNFDGSYKELNERFNATFGTNYVWTRRGYNIIERTCRTLGLFRYDTQYGYTEEEDAWLREYAPRYSSGWLAKNIESVSGRKHTYDAIKYHVREKLGINKGNGGVREDTVQTYKKPIGSLTSWGTSDVRIKIQDTGDDKKDWYPYARYVYEQHYGIKLPKDCQVMHLDGDSTNFDIANLEAVSWRENGILAANKWHNKGEITRTGIKYAKLNLALKDASCNL